MTVLPDDTTAPQSDDSTTVSIPVVIPNVPWSDWCAPHDDITVEHAHIYDQQGNEICTKE